MSKNERGVRLVVERRIEASPQHVFNAWTDANVLAQWWGPEGVTCPHAEIDARIGGAYRISNRLPDGSTVWITGEFTDVEVPSLLSYSWVIESPEGGTVPTSYVTVTFTPDGDSTIVRVEHTRIANDDVARNHEEGWHGCLAGLADWAESTAA